jgi:hypothetical protein
MLVCGSANRASFEALLYTELDERIVAQEVTLVGEFLQYRPNRRVVLELTPRHFTQTAAHFLSIATPVDWPLDEPDVD